MPRGPAALLLALLAAPALACTADPDCRRAVNHGMDLTDAELRRTLAGEAPAWLERALAESKRVRGEALDRCRHPANAKQITMATGTTPDLYVWGHRGQLTAALGNLVENAVNYSPPRTRVGIAGRRVAAPGGDLIEISVTDQGIGISQADRERIFERFYRVDPARSRATGGTGLGLSIVKHVAASHGGEVTVWSVEGQGSTFTLRLPEAGSAKAPGGRGPYGSGGDVPPTTCRPTT